jgi:hypothetical protein
LEALNASDLHENLRGAQGNPKDCSQPSDSSEGALSCLVGQIEKVQKSCSIGKNTQSFSLQGGSQGEAFQAFSAHENLGSGPSLLEDCVQTSNSSRGAHGQRVEQAKDGQIFSSKDPIGPESHLQGASSAETFQGDSGHQTLGFGSTLLGDCLQNPRFMDGTHTPRVEPFEDAANFLPMGKSALEEGLQGGPDLEILPVSHSHHNLRGAQGTPKDSVQQPNSSGSAHSDRVELSKSGSILGSMYTLGSKSSLQGVPSQETFQTDLGHQTLAFDLAHLKDCLPTPNIKVDPLARRVELFGNTAEIMPIDEKGQGRFPGGTSSGHAPSELQSPIGHHLVLTPETLERLDLQLGVKGPLKLNRSTVPDNTPLLKPSSEGSARTMDTHLSDFPNVPHSESSLSNAHSAPGSSVISFIARASRVKLPLTSQGYFSDPNNFEHFSGCADSWFKDCPDCELDPGNQEILRLIFEPASYLGIFRVTQKS